MTTDHRPPITSAGLHLRLRHELLHPHVSRIEPRNLCVFKHLQRVVRNRKCGGPDFPQMEPARGLARRGARLFEGGVMTDSAIPPVRKTLTDRRLLGRPAARPQWPAALRYKNLYNRQA